ncbi:hypothetical protein CLU79DRAFT_715713 [Phycomyces nitens]|nr:hypothetical protein CLU79DRAFT_715713 [Phycomyces nitens]
MALMDYDDDDEIPITLSAWGDQSAKKPSWNSLKDPNLTVNAGEVGSGGLHRRGRNFIPVSEDLILRQRLKGGQSKKASNPFPKTTSAASVPPKQKKTFPQSTTFSRHKPPFKNTDAPKPPPQRQPVPSTTRPPPPNSTWNTKTLVDVPFWEKKEKVVTTALITPATTPPKTNRPKDNINNGWKQQDYSKQNSFKPQQTNYHQKSSQQQLIYEQQKQQHDLLNQPSEPLSSQKNHFRKDAPSGRPSWLPDLQTNKPAWLDQPAPEPTKPSWAKESSWASNRANGQNNSYKPRSPDNRHVNNGRAPPGLSQPVNTPENNPVIITISIELESGIIASVGVRLLDDPERLSRDFGLRHNITDPFVLNALFGLFTRQKEATMQKRNNLKFA